MLNSEVSPGNFEMPDLHIAQQVFISRFATFMSVFCFGPHFVAFFTCEIGAPCVAPSASKPGKTQAELSITGKIVPLRPLGRSAMKVRFEGEE